ncbi:MAG: DUF2232 domain-containing protein, partial [Acidobacteriota bacterium]
LSYYRWGFPKGLRIPAGALLLGGLLLYVLGAIQAAPFYLGAIGLGVLLGAGMRRSWPLEAVIGTSGLFFFGVGAVIVLIAARSIEGGFFDFLEKDLTETLTLALRQFSSGTPEDLLMEQTLKDSVPTMVRLLPGAAFSSALVVSWLNVLVALRYCRVRRLPRPLWVSWSEWKAPEHLVWLVVASGFSLLMPWEAAHLVALNVLIVLGTVYLFQGLSVFSCYFERWRVPRIIRALLYGLFLFQQFATLGAILTGLFDMWFDFRRFFRKPSSDDE